MSNISVVRPSPRFLWQVFSDLFRSATRAAPFTYGSARYRKQGDRVVYEQTEISMQPEAHESAEAFMWRVWQEAQDGDVIDYRMRDGRLVGALLTRRDQVPLRPDTDETFEQFAARVQAFMAHSHH